MAAGVQVPGLATVKINAYNSLETLGYSVNGVNARMEAFFVNVPGDENGGHEGPPIDVQIMGQIAIVRLELSKYDSAVADKITARVSQGTAGTPSTAGGLMFAGALAMRLLIHSVSFPLNFPRAFPRGGIELNRGTRYATYVCEFECHKDGNGVLYNATTS